MNTDKKLSNLLKEFQISLKKKELTKLNQNTLINLLQLIELVEKKSFFQLVEEMLNQINISNDEKTQILIIKLESLVKELTEKKYVSKLETSNFTKYEYKDYIDFYVNRYINVEVIFSEFKKHNFLEIQIWPQDSPNRSKKHPLIFDKNITPNQFIENLDNHSLNIRLIKIRLITNPEIKSKHVNN